MADKISFERIRSHEALVCFKEHRTDCGVGNIVFLLLSDGHLIDCGSDRAAERRARVLAEIINEAGPERLSHSALSKAGGANQ